MDSSKKISVWIDSLSSTNISGSILNPSSSINLDLFSGLKFSIISAESAGSSSFNDLAKKSVSWFLIFSLMTLINSLLNSF